MLYIYIEEDTIIIDCREVICSSEATREIIDAITDAARECSHLPDILPMVKVTPRSKTGEDCAYYVDVLDHQLKLRIPAPPNVPSVEVDRMRGAIMLTCMDALSNQGFRLVNEKHPQSFGTEWCQRRREAPQSIFSSIEEVFFDSGQSIRGDKIKKGNPNEKNNPHRVPVDVEENGEGPSKAKVEESNTMKGYTM